MSKISLLNIFYDFNKYFKKYAAFIFIFVFCFTIRIFAVYQKDGLYIDELFTFVCTTPSNLSPEGVILKNSHSIYNFEYNKNYNAYEIKKALFESSSSPKSIVKDLKLIRSSNLDRSHTNLYYSLYRIASVGSPGLSYQQLLMRGCILNLLIFILEFFFMYKLLALINNNTQFKAFGLLISLLSLSSISNTLFIRNYLLMECFYVGTSYVFLSLLLKEDRLDLKKLCGYSFVIAAFILSGYLSLIYLGITFCILLFYSLFKKKFYIIRNSFIIMLISISIVLLIYPSFFNFSYKNEQCETVFANFNKLLTLHIDVIPTIKIIWSYLTKALFYYSLIGCTAIFYIFEYIYSKFFSKNSTKYNNNLKNAKLIFLLAIISIIYIFISTSLPMYKFERYIMPALPVLSLLLVFFVVNLKSVFLRYLLIALYISIPCLNLYQEMQYNKSNIDYLHFDAFYKFNENDKYVFHIGETFWYYSNFYILLPNNATIRFEKNIPSTNYDLKSYKLVTDIDIPKNTKKEFMGFCFNIYTINNK